MDKVCTELYTGATWHGRMANEFRKNGLRGFARWAEAEARGDFKSRACLEKLLCDNLDYCPVIDTTNATKAVMFEISGVQGLKPTLEKWYHNEKEFIDILTQAVRESTTINMSIYKELCGILEEVQAEAMRVKMCDKRLNIAGYNGHDIGIVSYLLHEHFEKTPDDRYVNVNLG